MSDLEQYYKLNKESYFSQPKDDFNRQELSSVNDPDKIVNLSSKVHSPEISTGNIKPTKTEDIDNNLVNNAPNEAESYNNPVESVKDILQEKPKSTNQENMVGGGSCNKTEEGGALSFSANSLPKSSGGALAFNDEELIKQMSALKKNDRVGSGALTTAAITSLITAAPQIIKAISDARKGKTTGEGSNIFLKDLSPDKYDEMEALMKQIKRQKNNFKFDESTREYVVGTGKFGEFMSKAWNKIKEIYGSEGFKPIKNALLNAASNTATKAINKVADKAASKVKNEDLKNIIDVTRETAQNAKDSIIEQSRGNGCSTSKKGGQSSNNIETVKGGKANDAEAYMSTQDKTAIFDNIANEELQEDECNEDQLTDPKNIFKKKSMDVHPGIANSKTIIGKYKKVRSRSVFL